MSESLVPTFMRVALQATHTQRALAVNMDLTILDSVNLQQEDMESERFTGVDAIQKAFDTGQPVITNNIRLAPDQAPTTNISFPDLRIVIVIPIMGHGAIYLDQPIRNGMVPKETVQKLMALGEQIAERGDLELSEADMIGLYEALT
jgi:hypothetical protein